MIQDPEAMIYTQGGTIVPTHNIYLKKKKKENVLFSPPVVVYTTTWTLFNLRLVSGW